MRYFICFLLSLIGLTGLAQEKRPSELAVYVGRDVKTMDADQRNAFITLFRSVSGDDRALHESDWQFVPQTLHEFADPEFRFFVEIAPGFDRPGFCGLRIHIFDDEWKFVRKGEFSTGYRQEIADVSRTKSDVLGQEVLVIKTASAGPWEVTQDGKRIGSPFFSGKHQLQFYAVVDGSLMLVRREDDEGRLIVNRYSNWTVPEIGMNYPKGTTEELIHNLESGADSKRLALLAWIAGTHMSSQERRVEGVSQEPIESSRAYEELMKSPKLNEIVRSLRSSENAWIRDYAMQIRYGEQTEAPERAKDRFGDD